MIKEKIKDIIKIVNNFYNFLKELIYRIINKKELHVSKEIRNQRLNECKNCESYKHGRCIECGCFVKPKSKFIYEMCLKDKWLI